MPPSSPPRVILVGCGAVARQFHVPALMALQNAGRLRVSVIIDPQVTARESVARAFPRAAQAPALDRTTAPVGTLVILASPPATHAALALMALERGWHVLCETPLAPTVGECEEMVAAARRHERILAVGLYRRFFPASIYLRTLCRDQLLGPLLSFSLHEGGENPRWPAGPSVFDREQTRGGVLIEPGVHALDLLGWWLGEPATVQYLDDAMGGLEANAFVQLTFPHGPQGRLHLSRDSATVHQHRLVFERGIATWRADDANGLTLQLAGAPAAVEGTLVTPLHEPAAATEPRALASAAQAFYLQLANVLDAMSGADSLRVPADEGAFSVRLIEQCYQHRRLAAQPWLSPEESLHAAESASAVPSTS